MIFTGFKSKSNQIFLRKRWPQLLKKSSKDKAGTIKKVFVILDDDSQKSFLTKDIVKALNITEKDVVNIVVQQNIGKENDDEDLVSQKDFGWYGKIKSEHLKAVLTNKYDLLINYSKVDNLYSNLLILQCKSLFNVGFEHLDNRFYDFMIDCKSDDFKSFNNELSKYLKILKKI